MSNAATQLNTRKNLPVQSSGPPKYFLNKLRELETIQAEHSDQGSRLLKIKLATALLPSTLVLTLALITLSLIF